MKAIVLRKERDLRLLDIPVPQITEKDQVLIKVDTCGICGSDIRYYYGENPWALHTLGYNVPNDSNIVLGHEFSGTVVKIGSSRYKELLHKRVIVQPWKGCGSCVFCTSGRENLCKKTRHIGHGQGWEKMDYYPGALAEYCIAWGDFVYEIPDDVSFESGSMSDLLGVAIHAVNRSIIIPGSDIICLGGGPVGILTAQYALHKGARNAYLVEKSKAAIEVIKKYDNCIPIDSEGTSALSMITSAIGESGCSVIYDSVGDNSLQTQFINMLAPSGYYVNLATQDVDFIIPKNIMGAERVVTTSSNACYNEIKESVDLIKKRIIDVEKIITHHCTFSTFFENFNLLLRDPKEALKVVMHTN